LSVLPALRLPSKPSLAGGLPRHSERVGDQGPADADLNQSVDLALDSRFRVALLLHQKLESLCHRSGAATDEGRPIIVPPRHGK
jgi:hypothetical protein